MFVSRTGLAGLRGKALVASITSVCATGNFLFGYDQGVMSGVVISKPWLAQMGHPSTLMIGTMTATYDIGAALGAFAAAFLGERLGRKWTLVLGTFVNIVGAIIIGAASERISFIFGRVILGVGIGLIMSVAPVYQSEIGRAAQRGWQVCCQQTTMLVGLMLAYWINYGMFFIKTDTQWRFPLLFQIVFAAYIMCFAPFLPDTPRWLMRHGETTEAVEVLSKLRGRPTTDIDVKAEADAISRAVALEAATEGGWKDLFKSAGIAANKRFYMAIALQFMQQLSGINIVTYYAPTLYKQSLGFDDRMSLFMGSFTQLWYIIASFVTWYTIDRIGRRRSFIAMAIGMCVVLCLEAITVSIKNKASVIAAVVFVFLFEACFTWGWMAGVWVYAPEILPLNIRAKGAALAAAADFLGNFLVVEITPPALENIGYKTYIIFAVFNICNAFIVWMFYPETAGLPLESVDTIFARNVEIKRTGVTEDATTVRKTGLKKLQWSIIPQAYAEIDRRRRLGVKGEYGIEEAEKITEPNHKEAVLHEEKA